MELTITERKKIKHHTEFEFPIYRSQTINEDESVYWKFDSKHSVTKIVDKNSEMSILHYQDDRMDFIQDFITSEDMLYGRYSYSIIPEHFYDSIVTKLINLVAKS